MVADEGAREAAGRRQVTAVLTENGPSGNGAQAYVTGTTVDTPARWRLPNGTLRTGLVQAGHGMNAGDPVEIWVDGAGNRTAPPMSTSDAVATAVAVLGWVGVVGVLALGCYVVHVACERRRMRGWQEGWRLLATNSYYLYRCPILVVGRAWGRRRPTAQVY